MDLTKTAGILTMLGIAAAGIYLFGYMHVSLPVENVRIYGDQEGFHNEEVKIWG